MSQQGLPPRGKARVAPLTISLTNSVRGCSCAGKSLQALHRQGDGQRNQGQLSCPQHPGTPLLDAPFRSDITVLGGEMVEGRAGPADCPRRAGEQPAHLRVGRGVCVWCVSPQAPLSKGRARPRREQLGLVCLRDMQDTCKHRPQARWHGHGSEGERGAPQAHAADIYNAITASAEAVQSTTGCKNSLSREQESQQK